MNNDRPAVRELLNLCMSLELELRVACAVLAAIQRANPAIQIEEALKDPEQLAVLRQAVQDRYRKVLESLDQADVTALMASSSRTKYMM